MRGPGGKSRLRSQVASLLQHVARAAEVSAIEDRYCGTLAISRGLYEAGSLVRAAIDHNEPLIRLYEAVRGGYVPPDVLTLEQYNAILHGRQDPRDPLTGFALCFCSHSGKFGSGYAYDDERHAEGTTSRSAAAKAQQDLLALRPMLQRIELRCEDATAFFPAACSLLFFDPPYEGTAEYHAAAPHDHARYRRRLIERSREHFIVASEFAMPPDAWREVAAYRVPSPGLQQRRAKTVRDDPRRAKVERFFVPLGGLSDALLRDVPFPGF